ncbi:MAG: hypothetical protein GY754_43330 [bacterium]|nr:hypothetical protein [bacterium]
MKKVIFKLMTVMMLPLALAMMTGCFGDSEEGALKALPGSMDGLKLSATIDVDPDIQYFGSKNSYYSLAWGDMTTDSEGNICITGSSRTGSNINASVRKLDSSGQLLWSEEHGSAANDVPTAIATDSNGNIYAVGQTYGSIDSNVNAGGRDMFLMKYDAQGNYQWTRQVGTPGTDIGSAVTVDQSDNVILFGYTNGSMDGNVNNGIYDVYMAKFSPSGQKIWSNQWGASSAEYPSRAFLDTADNIYIIGFTTSALPNNTLGLGYDAYMAKFDAYGNIQWAKQTGSAKSQIVTDAKMGSDGNIYVSGVSNKYVANQVVDDVFAMKYDISGNVLSYSEVNTSFYTQAYSIALDSANNAYLIGRTFGDFATNAATNVQTFLMKFNSSGLKQGVVQLNENNTSSYNFLQSEGHAIAIGNDDKIHTMGYANGYMFLATFAPDDIAPTLSFTTPGPVNNQTSASSYTIEWTDEDPDSDASISLYYGTDINGSDKQLITSGISEDADGASDTYAWDISGLSRDTYYVFAVVTDGTNTITVRSDPLVIHRAEVIFTNGRALDSWINNTTDTVYFAGQNGLIVKYDHTSTVTMQSNTSNSLSGIWGSADNNIYAVGSYNTMLHYNGSTWQAAAHPDVSHFEAIAGKNASDIYAMSSNTLLHFDGTSWTEVALDFEDVVSFGFISMWVSQDPNTVNVQIIVKYTGSDNQSRNGVLQFNGTSWDLLENTPQMDHLCGPDGNDLFAGSFYNIYNFNGTSWAKVADYGRLYYMSYAGNTVYAVGNYASLRYLHVINRYNNSVITRKIYELNDGSDMFGHVWVDEHNHIFIESGNKIILL